MIDLDEIPEVTFKTEDDNTWAMLGLLPVVIGIIALLVLMVITEI